MRAFVAASFRLFLCLLASRLYADVEPENIEVRLGEQRTVIPAGRHDLNYFSDEGISILQQRPTLRFLVVNGNYTVLMEGKTFESAIRIKNVLEPSRSEGTYDQGYTGVGGVYIHGKEVVALFHAEDHFAENEKKGSTRFYASIGAAVSHDRGNTFQKLGPVLQGRLINRTAENAAQGDADPCLIVDHTNTWLYAYYTEHTHSERMSNGTTKGRSCITCMARSRLIDQGKPGTWKKYFQGSFSEPGINGWDSCVAEMWTPNVSYLEKFGLYVMVGTSIGGNSGLVINFSEDGIHWGSNRYLFGYGTLPVPDRDVVWHPKLYTTDADSKQATGWLLYSHSPRWGGDRGQTPHFFVKRSITMTVRDSPARVLVADNEPPKKQVYLPGLLLGSRWKSGKNESWELDKRETFFYNGKQEKAELIGEYRARITFSDGQVNVLEFDKDLKQCRRYSANPERLIDTWQREEQSRLGNSPEAAKTTETTGNVDQIKKRLAGTKWLNTNNVSFEWTADGRFLHNGKEREWKAIDGSTVEITFGPSHVDRLVFDSDLAGFKQLIRGGPNSFQGKPAK